jgi:predicted dehydrogenase
MHQQKIRIVGEKASIEWWDEHPNQLRYEVQDEPARILDRDMGYLYKDAEGVAASHVGGGHAEGYFESWANLYHRFALVMDATNRGDTETANSIWYPGIEAGIDGVRLCEKCVESADNRAAWVDFK